MSDGIGKNPLNDISKVYLEMRESYKIEPPKERLKTDRNMFNIPKDEQDAAKERLLAKAAAKRAKVKEELDPVGQEDGDVDNDGDKDKSDKYLMKRRKAITKAMKTRKEEVKLETESVVDNPKHAANFKKSADEYAKKLQKRKKVSTEGFSDWRSDLVEADLIEVMDEDEADKPIKEKKVNNKIKINPKLGEAIEEIGGVVIEESEIDEVIESIYIELIEEGYSEDDVEEAIEFALIEELNEVSDSYYDSAVKASKQAADKKRREEMMKRAKGRLRFMKRKAGEAVGKLKGKVAGAAAAATMAPAIAKDQARRTGRAVKQAVTSAPGKAKKSIKDRIKQGALAVAKRMSEDVELDEAKKKLPYLKMFRKAGNLGRDGSPEAMERSKKITGVMNADAKRREDHRQKDDAAKDAKTAKKAKIDEKINPLLKGILKKTPKGEDPKKGGVPYKLTGKMTSEEMSVKKQMEFSKKYNRMSPEEKKSLHKKATAGIPKVAPKKDTRTSAEKMADAYASKYKGAAGGTRAD